MAKSSNLLIPGLIAAGAAAFYFFKGKARSMQNLSYEPVKIAIDSAASGASFYTTLYYNVTLKIINNDAQAVRVKGANLIGYVNGAKVATVVSNASINVPARSFSNVVFTLRINTLNVGAAVFSAIKDGDAIDIKGQGVIMTDLGELNVSFTKKVAL